MQVRKPKSQRLSQFASRLLAQWRQLKLPLESEPVIVAVSGGADSTALLLGIDELRTAGKVSVTVFVAHLDHQLRSSSRKDARWVSSLARQFGYTPVVGRAKVAEIAQARADNLEQAARISRYEFLERTAKRKHARLVLTGHTMDDQAETVLMRLMRGSSPAGLSGMEARRPIRTGSDIILVRPLLLMRRNQTEDYCRDRKIDYLHDEMNEDERFSRVKVRKQLVPVMQMFNKRVVEALSRTASLLSEDRDVLLDSSDNLLKQAARFSIENGETKAPPLDVLVLANAPAALRRRALRQWIANGPAGSTRRLEMVHLLAVERLVTGKEGGKVVELPNGYKVRRKRGRLEFEAKND
jgi:tRNA(Ile)-lysidine synthase